MVKPTASNVPGAPGAPISERSRLTRRIARALLKTAVRDDVIAHQLAASIVDDLIQEYGGGKLYVPIADTRPGGAGNKRDGIEASLRSNMDADVLRTPGGAPLEQIATVAREHNASIRTVWRVLQRIRAEHTASMPR